ncbi:hypothetical protein VCR26J2_680048 [Vibrio coralliirubri]|nr:hypothetical protein VCR26J2_680048 [Vibrio coralliirubri]
MMVVLNKIKQIQCWIGVVVQTKSSIDLLTYKRVLIQDSRIRNRKKGFIVSAMLQISPWV